MIDPRANSPERLVATPPLPHVSRRALKRVKHPLQIPETCPHCFGGVRLVNNGVIYGREYGDWPYAYLCSCCNAYVGLHPDTDLPLGTLATTEIRAARNRCKKPFERIWRESYMDRVTAYRWLAESMRLTAAQCHFGLFDVEQCEIAEALALAWWGNK